MSTTLSGFDNIKINKTCFLLPRYSPKGDRNKNPELQPNGIRGLLMDAWNECTHGMIQLALRTSKLSISGKKIVFWSLKKVIILM
jgi:hypothetical protein